LASKVNEILSLGATNKMVYSSPIDNLTSVGFFTTKDNTNSPLAFNLVESKTRISYLMDSSQGKTSTLLFFPSFFSNVNSLLNQINSSQ
jgi:hypothetical protein